MCLPNGTPVNRSLPCIHWAVRASWRTASSTQRPATPPTRSTIAVFGHDEQLLVVSRYDNLGKGAAGAAVQNLNLMLGMPDGTGLAANEID